MATPQKPATDGLNPTLPPITPTTPSTAATEAAGTQNEASTADAHPAARKTAREKIAALLWWSIPSCDDEEAKARTEQLLDEHRAEVLAKAIARLRAIPVTCTALTGPVWYGTGWRECITALEDIADYQTPDDEAYPGELQRLRALALAIRVVARNRRGRSAEQQRAEVERVMDAHDAWEKTATKDTTPGFFRPGRTFARQHHGDTIRFFVEYISTSPDGRSRAAHGWRTRDWDTGWEPTDSDDFTGWTDITEAGEGR